MIDRRAQGLSWTTTLFCCSYILWISYRLGIWISSFGKLFPGLGSPLPPVTVFVLGLSRGTILLAGGLLIAGLILKEALVKSDAVRTAITLIVFMSVVWFSFFVLDAIYKPLFELLDKIG